VKNFSANLNDSPFNTTLTIDKCIETTFLVIKLSKGYGYTCKTVWNEYINIRQAYQPYYKFEPDKLLYYIKKLNSRMLGWRVIGIRRPDDTIHIDIHVRRSRINGSRFG